MSQNKKNKIPTRISARCTQSESEKTILDILLMSVSCIAFLRGFFNNNYFIDDKFEISKYDFDLDSTSKDSIKIKKLKRGVSTDSDIILNWINVSISDALHKKYLKAIDLSIILNEEHPNDIFESYCFKIEYLDSTQQSISFNEDLFLSPNELTRFQIFKLLKRFIILTQSLPPLPAKRFLAMRLLFNDNCPNDYFPEYFTNCSDEKSAIIRIPLPEYNNLIANCGDVNSVHHQISTSLISLSNLNAKNYKDVEILELDPFDIFGNNAENPKNENNIATELSQVTKDLSNMVDNFENELHDGETQIYESEKHEPIISCTCKSNMYLPYSSIIQCTICLQSMHKVCYSMDANFQSFECINCSKYKNSININDMLIIFNIRKLIAYFKYNKKNNSLLNSISFATLQLGFNISDLALDDTIVKNTVNALSVLIFDGIISFKTHKSFLHHLFNVDIDGLLVKNTPVKKGKYFIRFILKNNEDKINRFLDPNFGKLQEMDTIIESLSSLNQIDFDQTIIEENGSDNDDKKEEAVIKKKKISKSVDIFKV